MNQSKKRYKSYVQYAALAAALQLQPGCARDPSEPTEPQHAEVERGGASGQIILDWNLTASEVAKQADPQYQDPFTHLRALTLMHLAMHDAVNGVSLKYEHYAKPLSDSRADPLVAAAAAAHGVLSAVYPGQRALLDSKLEASFLRLEHGAPRLEHAAKGKGKERGLSLGKAVAEEILRSRAADGADASEAYTPGEDPGRYRFVPPFDFIYRPAFRNVKPLALDAGDQFRSAPPPSLGSAEYATAYAEVQTYGRASGSSRSAEQTIYADWWYELSEIGWNRIARTTWQNQPRRSLWFTARLFALVNVSLLDAYIAGWDSKLHYDFWRPYTAIRSGAADGNADTAEESAWEPYCVTPPIQDYPSTHSALGAAAAEVLYRVYGGDVPFEIESTSSKPPGQKRSFSAFRKASDENADSRVACGIHFRFATGAGLELGKHVGTHAVESILLPNRRERLASNANARAPSNEAPEK